VEVPFSVLAMTRRKRKVESYFADMAVREERYKKEFGENKRGFSRLTKLKNTCGGPEKRKNTDRKTKKRKKSLGGKKGRQ